MKRSAVLGLLLTAAFPSPGMAETGPRIAYSTQTEVYLINPDGSGKVRLYRSRSNDFISSVSLKPGGGQIAFVENWTVKVADFDAQGRLVGPIRSIHPSCYRIANARYSPDGNSLLYTEFCGQTSEIKRSAVPTSSTPVPQASVLYSENSDQLHLLEVAWGADGNSIFYSLSTPTQNELRKLVPGVSDDLLYARVREQIRYPDVSADGSRILMSNYPLSSSLGTGYSSELNTADGSVSPNFKGQYARYEPGGTNVVFIDYTTYNARYLRVRAANGTQSQIGGKAVYWSVDWRR